MLKYINQYKGGPMFKGVTLSFTPLLVGNFPSRAHSWPKIKDNIRCSLQFATQKYESLILCKEFKEKLANELMSKHKEKYLNYHDKKIYDDVLAENTFVYMYLPWMQ